jgi:hypothetical protein
MKIFKIILPLVVSLITFGGMANATDFGTFSSAGCQAVINLTAYRQWLGVPSQHVTENWAQDTWASLSSDAGWSIGCFAPVRGNIAITFSLPMLTADNSSTLAQGAAGANDAAITQIGNQLVAAGFSSTIIRIGWEFNGNWQPWDASKDPPSFVAYFQRMVNLLRAVPGQRFLIEWCPNIGTGSINPETVYPGDAYVDIIGIDIYDNHWNSTDELPAVRWSNLVNEPNGLQWQLTFAAAHNKRVSIPEWACCGNNSGDDPYFIQQMYTWLIQNNYLYADYYDQNYNGTWQISNNQWPSASTLYRQLFGLRPTTP